MLLAVAAATTMASGSGAAQRIDVPEADRYIQLGTRLPPLPPGQGGQLFVSAPEKFCADAGYILEINHHPDHTMNMPAARMVAGPSTCAWIFDDMPPGSYSATLHVAPNGAIVATGRAEVLRAASQTLALGGLQTEVEGLLRVNGTSPPPGIRLVFRNSSKPWLEWEASLEPTGVYRVALDASHANERICSQLRRVPPLNAVPLQCADLAAGVQQLDLDAALPRGVLRIDVPPVADAAFTAFARITISDSDDASRGYLTSFKFARGLRGDYIADLDRDYRIIVSRSDDMTVVTSALVTPTAEHPDVRVRLPVKLPAAER
jgi:hypothetical protein